MARDNDNIPAKVIGTRSKHALIQCEVFGMTPLMQCRFSEDAEISSSQATRRTKIAERTPRDAAESVCYRNTDGELYVPSTQIRAAIIEAGSNHKQRGNRKSLKYILGGALTLLDEQLLVIDPSTGKPYKTFEVDSRPVTIPATKGKVMRHRPRFDKWKLAFEIRINLNLVDVETVAMLLAEAGEQFGIGDWRPQRMGSFGTFFVSKFDRLVDGRSSQQEAAE